MNTVNVPGQNNKHKVLIYALSTCVWCKKTKQFLQDNNVQYDYVDVDKCSPDDAEKISDEVTGKGGRLSFPVVLIDDHTLINGFRPDEIKEALGV